MRTAKQFTKNAIFSNCGGSESEMDTGKTPMLYFAHYMAKKKKRPGIYPVAELRIRPNRRTGQGKKRAVELTIMLPVGKSKNLLAELKKAFKETDGKK